LEPNERVRRAGLDTNREIPCRVSGGQMHSAHADSLTRLF
jgi:hypothetical protein